MNEIKMSGRLGREVEVNQTRNGKDVCRFSLACYAGKEASGETKTEWFEFEAWDTTARIASRAKVGDMVIVNGSAKINAYEDKDGNHIKRVVFVAKEIFIEPKRSNEAVGEEIPF